MSFSILTSPSHGNLSINQNGEWIYNVDTTYKGSDFVQILIDDSHGAKVVKTLNFTIDNSPINGNNKSNVLLGKDSSNDILKISMIYIS